MTCFYYVVRDGQHCFFDTEGNQIEVMQPELPASAANPVPVSVVEMENVDFDIPDVSQTQIHGTDSLSQASICQDGRWRHGETLELLEAYGEFMPQFNDCKRRKNVWSAISNCMQERGVIHTPAECESKFKQLKRTYISKKIEKRSTSQGRNEWAYYEKMHELLRDSPEFTAPVITCPAVPSTFEQQLAIPVVPHLPAHRTADHTHTPVTPQEDTDTGHTPPTS